MAAGTSSLYLYVRQAFIVEAIDANLVSFFAQCNEWLP